MKHNKRPRSLLAEIQSEIAVLLIRDRLLANKGDVQAASRDLGISRYTLYRYLAWSDEREPDDDEENRAPHVDAIDKYDKID